MRDRDAHPGRQRRALAFTTFYAAYLVAVAVGAAWTIFGRDYDGSAEQRRSAFHAVLGWGIYVAAIALVGNALVFVWLLRRRPPLPAMQVVVFQALAGVAAVWLAHFTSPGISLLILPAAVTAAIYGAVVAATRGRGSPERRPAP